MSKSQRMKGANGEREVVKMFRAYGFEAHRSASAQRAKDAVVCDVEGTPYWVEVKRQKKPNIHAAYEQAAKESLEAKDTRFPVAFTRRDRGRWLVTLDADVFLEMAEMMGALKEWSNRQGADVLPEDIALLLKCQNIWGRR